jgi:hypothetical protein
MTGIIALQSLRLQKNRWLKNKVRYELLEEKKKEWTTQNSTTDQDESPLVQGVVVEISYNIQAAVDNKHNLVVATHTINRNDLNKAIALEAKENLGM